MNEARPAHMTELHDLTAPYVAEIERLRTAIARHRRDVEWANVSTDPAAWREHADGKLWALVPEDERDDEELDDA